MSAFKYAACFVGIALAGITAAEVHAKDIPGPPSAPCNLGQRMNVHFVDGWMYACDCEVLAHGFVCRWNLVGQVATPAVRRFKRHHSRLIPVLVIHPGVVA